MTDFLGEARDVAEAELKAIEKKEKAKADYEDYLKGLDLIFEVNKNGETTEEIKEALVKAEEAGKRQLEDDLGEVILLKKDYLGAIEARCGGRMRMLGYLSTYKDEVKEKINSEKVAVSEGLTEYRKKAKEALFGTANVRRITFEVKE